MAGKAMPELAIVDNNTLAALGLKETAGERYSDGKDQASSVHSANLSRMHPNGSCTILCPCTIRSGSSQLLHRRGSIAPIPSCLHPATTPTRSCRDSTASASTYRNASSSRTLMRLQRSGHPHGEHIPPMDSLRVQGESPFRQGNRGALAGGTRQNQQGDSRTTLSSVLTTVITHRKNIQEKLGIKSVSSLTIYAVMHGYVDINKI